MNDHIKITITMERNYVINLKMCYNSQKIVKNALDKN